MARFSSTEIKTARETDPFLGLLARYLDYYAQANANVSGKISLNNNIDGDEGELRELGEHGQPTIRGCPKTKYLEGVVRGTKTGASLDFSDILKIADVLSYNGASGGVGPFANNDKKKANFVEAGKAWLERREDIQRRRDAGTIGNLPEETPLAEVEEEKSLKEQISDAVSEGKSEIQRLGLLLKFFREQLVVVGPNTKRETDVKRGEAPKPLTKSRMAFILKGFAVSYNNTRYPKWEDGAIEPPNKIEVDAILNVFNLSPDEMEIFDDFVESARKEFQEKGVLVEKNKKEPERDRGKFSNELVQLFKDVKERTGKTISALRRELCDQSGRDEGAVRTTRVQAITRGDVNRNDVFLQHAESIVNAALKLGWIDKGKASKMKEAAQRDFEKEQEIPSASIKNGGKVVAKTSGKNALGK